MIAVTISNAHQKGTPIDLINAIKEAGFKHVFIEWYNKDWEISQQQQLDYVRKLGLNVIFAHLGYQKINNIWLEGEIGEGFVERYKNDLKLCRENGIDLVCMHLTSKSEAPEPNEIGLKRFQEIADYAQELGIKIAFENTKIKGYQEYILKNIKNDNVGICLDSGHLHAHFKDELNFDLFKDKIFCVHLHDNHGEKDEHLIPFEGTIDWNWLMDKLIECNYKG
ncbi:MAG: sugar phosphate isomerase/epimerase, partial [Erysipelotrichaceae bacterium]|nr:sugar phosphate isomerase/epimerase [Erysipelotrichaceae bacterium]